MSYIFIIGDQFIRDHTDKSWHHKDSNAKAFSAEAEREQEATWKTLLDL